MERCRVTTVIADPLTAVWKFQHLIELDRLEAIARDLPPDLVGKEKTTAALPHIEGGYIECADSGTHRYLKYKDQFYVGGNNLEFKAPMSVMPPDGLRFMDAFLKFIHEYPNYYKQWNRSIQEKAQKHGCECVGSGASWHLNWQECLCPGNTLDEAGEKWERLEEDIKK